MSAIQQQVKGLSRLAVSSYELIWNLGELGLRFEVRNFVTVASSDPDMKLPTRQMSARTKQHKPVPASS
ncbi:hypothetical protein Tcan_09848 [Toxocara canis]|uniref:Uncharacterized protein n=1 Tax=Toxocara canis TaxID=6265 RepID=A0A0B2VH87_TOXCA|nr:hypothetical protein Tcan_09848 [Toxocara canis]